MSEGAPSAADVPDGQLKRRPRVVRRPVRDAWRRSRRGCASNRVRDGGECVDTSPERSLRSVRLGERCSTLGKIRAAERRFVPFVRRSAGRAVLDPARRSGSGTDPPVFYGGKAGKSLTAIPIMAPVARFWKVPAAFARGYVASVSRRHSRRRGPVTPMLDAVRIWCRAWFRHGGGCGTGSSG